jgi:hypothetical protein
MITIKNAVLNFPSLFQLPVINNQQAKKYSTKIILDPDAHKAVLKQIKDEMERLRTTDLKGVKLPPEKYCLRNGDDMMKEEYEGKFVLSASCKRRPTVVKAEDGQLVPVTEDDGLIYSGCVANVNVTFWAQDNKDYGKRINCELIAVQWRAEGTPLGGGGISREAALKGFDLDSEDFG